MSNKGTLRKAQKTIAQAAKAGAAGAKDVASDALGAAATAAAGVVLQRVSQTLAGGQQKVERAVPAEQPAMAGLVGRSKTRRMAARPKSGPRKSVAGRKKLRVTANRMRTKDSKRAAAKKKTLKKVASRNRLRRRSGAHR